MGKQVKNYDPKSMEGHVSDSISESLKIKDKYITDMTTKTNKLKPVYDKKRAGKNLSETEEKELNDVFGQYFEQEAFIAELEKQEREKAEQEKYQPKDEIENELATGIAPEEYKGFKDMQSRYDELSSKTYSGMQQLIFKQDQERSQLKHEEDDWWITSAGKSIWNGLNTIIDAGLSHVGAGISQLSSDYKFTKEEEKEYEKLQKDIAKYRNPILEKKKKELIQKRDELLKTETGTFGVFTTNSADSEEGKNTMARIMYDDAIELYDDAINNGGFLSGLDNDLAGTLTLNIANMEEASTIKELTDKIKNGQELTPGEQTFVSAYMDLNNAKYSGLNKNMSYQLGEGIKETGKFIGEVAVVNRITGGLGSGMTTLAETGTFGKAGIKMAELGAKVPKGLTAPTSEIVRAGVSPSSYIKADEKYASSLQEITDIEGNKQLLATNSKKLAEANKFTNAIKIVDNQISALVNKESLTPEEEIQLNKLELKKQLFSENLNKLVDRNGNIIFEEKSNADALIYGITENVKERFSERFVGGAVDNFVPAVGSYLNKTKLGKLYDGSGLQKAVNKLDDVSTKQIRKGREFVDRTLFESNKLGKLSKSLANHTGSAKVMHSLPAEMIEEIAVQLTPTYQEDYSKQLEELRNPDFYTMVAAQTLILGGFTGSVGASAHYYNYATNKDYRDQYNSNKESKKQSLELYNRLDNAIDDDQLAQDIAMSTMGSIFQVNDYNGRIAELRNPNTNHKDSLTQEERNKKADIMERNSFYNLAINSINNGTDFEFKKSLERLTRNEKVSEDTRKNASLGLQKLNQIQAISEQHKNKLNYSSILDLSIRENINNETINDLQAKINESKKKATTQIDMFNRMNNFDSVLFNVDNMVMKLETEEQEGEYNNWLARLKEEDIPEVNQYLDNLFTKEMLEKQNYEVSKKLRYELNPNNASIIKKREEDKLKKQATQNVNVNNAEQLKQKLAENNLETPDVIQEINNKAIEDSNKVPEVLKEQTSEDTDFFIPDSQLDEQFGANFLSELDPIDKSKTPGIDELSEEEKAIINQNQGELFSPVMFDEENDNHKEKLKTFEKGFKNIISQSPNVPFKNVMANLSNKFGINQVDEQFYIAAKAWNNVTNNSLSNQDIENAHIAVFGGTNLDVFANAFSTATIVSKESVPVIENKEVDESLKQEKVVTNLVTGEQVKVYKGRKFADVGLKAGFLGLNYNDTEDEKVTISTTVNENALPFVDPRNFRPGTEVELTFDYDYLFNKENLISVWNDVDTDRPYKQTVTVDKFLENLFPGQSYNELVDILQTNPETLLQNEELLKSIPVGIKNNGQYNSQKDVLNGGLNDYYWFNASNVALKEDVSSTPENTIYNVGEQRQRIEENRELNLETRKQILNNKSLKLKVENKTVGQPNVLLLKTDEEKQLGHSLEFQSIFNAFQNQNEEAKKNSAIGVVINNQIVASGKDGQRQLIKVNGKEVSTDNIVNWNSFVNEVKDREGNKNNSTGKVVFVTQAGFDSNGNPNYVLHNVINNHEKKQAEFKTINEIKYKLISFSDILNGKKQGSAAEVEKANKVRDNIKNMFGLDISVREALNTVLDFYPENIKDKEGNRTDNFKQDYNPKLASSKRANNIPNLLGFQSVAEFESAYLTNNITSVSYSDILYNNLHTQYIYTPVKDVKGETMWTNEVQPVITYNTDHVVKTERPSIEQNIAQEREILKNKIAFNQSVLKEIENEEDKKEIVETIEQAKQQLEVLEQVQPSNEKIRQTETREFDNSDLFQVVENIVFNALSKLNVNNKITKSEIYSEIEKQYNDLLKRLEEQGLTNELEFVKANKDEILGNGYYDNSAKEVIDALFDLSEETDLLDLTGENIKNHSKESYENNIADSLSLKVKLLLSGIKDTRFNNESNFAGFSNILSLTDTLDALQQLMSEINNNNLVDLKQAINNKLQLNEKEYGFYRELLERIENIEKIDNSILNEILYNLYQPKVKMAFVLFNQNSDGSYTMEKYDANTKNPLFVKRTKWNENFKNSPLITKFEEGFYKINPDGLIKYNELYQNISDNPSIESLKEYFDFLGIKLNNKLYEMIFDENDLSYNQLQNLIFSTTGIIENINKNINKANNSTMTLAFSPRVITDNSTQKVFNILSFDNSRLNDLINADNNVSFIPMNMMYIGGKMINVYEQPKRITNILKKLKNDDNFRNQLLSSQISSNNFLLNLINENQDLRQYVDVIMTSLEAIKEKGSPSSDKMSITQLSEKDAFVTLFNMFASTEGVVNNEELNEQGIKLRKAIVNFPTLSDSSQLPLFKTVVLDIQKENIVGNNVSENVMNILINQLVKGDLLRIGAFLNANISTNIKGHDAGALFIGSMSSLNTVAVDYSYQKENGEVVDTKRTLIEVFRNNSQYHTPEGVNMFIDQFKDDITNEINRNIQHEVNQFINEDGTNGFFVKNEIYKNNTLHFIDSNYLQTKKDVTELEQARLVAFDYVINQLMQQKEIQTTFAGDLANYFKDNMTKDLVNGHPPVNSSDVINYFYKDYKSQIESLIRDKQFNTLFERFPKMKYSSDFITSEISHEEQYQEVIIPAIQMKTKKVFEDVQNNLSKRLKALISPGNQFPNSRGNKVYKQLMIKDVENSSEVLEHLAKTYHADVYESVVNDLRRFKTLDNIYEQNRTKEQNEEHKKLFNDLTNKLPLIKSYFKTASTDAQEYTSWKDNLDQLLEQGRITGNEYKTLHDKFKAQEKDLDENGTINPENRLTEEERKIAIMQPSKPLYSGLHFENINGYNLQRDVYVKSSSFPIIPELAEMFPKLNYLRKTINKLQEGSDNTVVRISYDSANKVGAVKNAIHISELYNDDINLERINSSVVELNRENFYIQQDKPFKSDKNAEKGKYDSNTRATQFEKIILGDGIDKIKDNVFPNMFDSYLLEELGIEEVNGMINGPALKKMYVHLYQKEQNLLKEKLFRELGIKNYSDIQKKDVNAMEKIASLLNKRLSNKQDKKSIELVYQVQEVPGQKFSKKEIIENNYTAISAEFKIPLFMTPNSKKFESVLNSVINKNSINLTLPGFSSPVASQEGFDFKIEGQNTSIEDLKSKGLITTKNFDPSKGLQATRNEDGSLKYAQIFIANKYKVFNRETGKYDYIDLQQFVDENGQIDTSKLPEELLSMFSFRIPTSSHQSGVMLEVAGFLPHTVGDLMIVPKDHTVQIGEDYDIDTRYVYNYHYIQTENGSLKKLESSDIINLSENLENLRQEFESYKKELFDDYFKVSIDTNSPLGKNTVINNNYWYSNREKLLEIAVLEDSIENYNEDRVLHAIFQDMYDFQPIATREEMQEKINELKASLIPSDVVREKGKQLKSEYHSILSDLKDAYRNDRKQIKQAYHNYGGAIQLQKDMQKVIENNIVSMYKSVFSSNSNEVQSLINQTLSTDFAENTAATMNNVLSDNQNNIYNIYSPTTQSKIMALGADGKMGIGVHSNAVTMNSLLQQYATISDNGKSDIEFIQYYDEESGKPVPYKIQLGKMIFDGQLGKIHNNGFRISERGMESQNSATDNQKLQIMGRRNENAETINVFAILQATGLDNDGIKVNGEELSYASLFINQPILREYVDLIKKYKSVTNSNQTNAEKVALQEIRNKYFAKVDKGLWEVDSKGKPIKGKFKREVSEKLGKALTSEKLFDSLLTTESDITSQLYILDVFKKLQKPAREYNRLQKFVNIENGGLGVSYFDTIELMNEMIDITQGAIDITKSANMIGDLKVTDDNQIAKNLESEGYIKVKTDSTGLNYLIKPTNHYSWKIVNSITNGYNLWSSLFPYESKFIEEQINTIIENSNVNRADIKELNYKVISELKDYIYSNNKTLFNGKPNEVAQQLFFDNNENKNQSLASYLLDLSNNQEFEYLFKLPFFKDLQFEINEGTYPSTVKYNSNDISKLNNLNVYNTLNRFVNSDKKLLDRNGKTYTEADLMKDLLMYSMLANQENGAIGFRHLLPMELFDKYNVPLTVRNKTGNEGKFIQNLVYNGLSKSVESMLGARIDNSGIVNNVNSVPLSEINTLVSLINNQINIDLKTNNVNYVSVINDNGDVEFTNFGGEYQQSTFVRQFFQHNSRFATTIPYEFNETIDPYAKKTPMQKILADNKMSIKDFTDGKMTSFYYEFDGDYLVLKDNNGNNRLYERKEENYFEQIPTLGAFGFNEYQTGRNVNKSSVEKNNPKTFTNAKIVPGVIKDIINNETLQTILSSMQSGNNNPYKGLLDLILPLVDVSNTKIEVVPSLKGNGSYNADTNTIKINEQYLLKEPTLEQVNNTIIEEFLHSITKNTIEEYVNIETIDNNGKLIYDFKADKKAPASLRTLMLVYQQAIDQIVNEQGIESVLNTINKFNNVKSDNDTSNSLTVNSQNELDVYRVSDIHEFIAGIFIKNSKFAKKMATVKYLKSDNSILDKFVDTLGKLFYSILPNKRKDSISAETLKSLYDFLIEHNDIKSKGSNVQESKFNNQENNKVIDDAMKLLENNDVKVLTVRRESKKSKYKINLKPGMYEMEKEGYRLIIEEYPDAIFYITKDFAMENGEKLTGKNWQIDNVNTGFIYPTGSARTLNEIVDYFEKDVIEKSKDSNTLKTLKTTGLFVNEQHSPIENLIITAKTKC